VRTADPAAAVAALDGRVEERDGDRLVVRAEDPAELNALLVRGSVPVSELVAERRTLEQVVLARTAPGSDRVMPS
jgi:ABC-2 type transport system ATP-binding protein